MVISDYLSYLNPANLNVFGIENSAYSGLLEPQDAAALSKRSNIAGLLGTAAAIAQGMGSQGPRRSATQNILSALGTGYGAAGQAYQGGIEQMVNAQKLAQMKLQMQQNTATQAAINKLRLDPNIDETTKTALLVDPTGTIKNLSEMQQFRKLREQYLPPPPAAAPTVPGQIEGQVLQEQSAAGKSEISQLETMRNGFLADAQTYAVLRDSVKSKAALESADKILERQQQLIASDIDIKDRIKNAPPGFVQQYETVSKIKETLKPKDYLDAIQKIDQAVLESRKQYRYDGITGQYAYNKYGTMDASQLNPDERQDVLAFANAPNQADILSNLISSKRLQAERGVGVSMPKSREEFLRSQPTTALVVPTAPVVEGQTAPRIRGSLEPMVDAPAPMVAPELQRAAEVPVVQPQAVQPPVVAPTIRQPQVQPQAVAPTIRQPQAIAPSVQTQAQPAPPKAKPLVDIGKTVPLIKQPDIKVPLATKQKLLEQQNGATSATSYALTNIKDARDVAKSLLDNPMYIKALSGAFAPKLSEYPIGPAYDAKQILDNLLGRSFITEIAEMRANSPTGGAVGNVAVAEMEALSKIRGALKVGMSEKELKNQLQTYINNSDRALRGIPKRYAEIYGYDGQFDDILTGTVIPQGNNQPVDPITQELQRRKQAAKKGNKP